MICDECGVENDKGVVCCEGCGKRLIPEEKTYRTQTSGVETKGKPKLNMKTLAIIGVVAVVAIAAVVVLVSSIGVGGLSGRYSSSYGSYIEFSGGNQITMYDGLSVKGTYTVNGNQLNVKVTITIMGYSDTETIQGTISDDKREITLAGTTYTK